MINRYINGITEAKTADNTSQGSVINLVQATGEDENVAMSQKAITDAVNTNTKIITKEVSRAKNAESELKSLISNATQGTNTLFVSLPLSTDDIVVDCKINKYVYTSLNNANTICNLSIINSVDGDNGQILLFQEGGHQLSFSDSIIGFTDIPRNSGTITLLEFNNVGGVIYIRNTEILGDVTYQQPSKITDLNYIYVDNQSCSISWTSPTGNQFNNAVSYYDIRYSNTAIAEMTDRKWSGLSILNNNIVPKYPDETETVTFSNLPANTEMYIYIKGIRLNGGIRTYSEVSNVIHLKTLGLEDTSKAYQIGLKGENIYPQHNHYHKDDDLGRTQILADLVDEENLTECKDDGYPDLTVKQYQTGLCPYQYDRANANYTILFDLYKVIKLDKIFTYALATAHFNVYGLADLNSEWVLLGKMTHSFHSWASLSFEKASYRYVKIVFESTDVAKSILGDEDEGIIENYVNPGIGRIGNIMFYGSPNMDYPIKYEPVKRRLVPKPTVDEFFCVNAHAYQDGKIHSMCSGEKVRLYCPGWIFNSTNPKKYGSVKDYRYSVSENPWTMGNNSNGDNLEDMLEKTYKKNGLKPFLTFSNTSTMFNVKDTTVRPIDNYIYENLWTALPSKTKGLAPYYEVTYDPASYKTISKEMYAIAAKYGSNRSINGSELFYPADGNMETGNDLICGIEYENEPNQTWSDWHGYERAEEYAAYTSACTDGNGNSFIDSENRQYGSKNADNKLLSIAGGLAAASTGYLKQVEVHSKKVRADHKTPYDVLNIHKYASVTGDQHSDSKATHTYAVPVEFNCDNAFVSYRDTFAQDKPIWITEFGYGESGSRYLKNGYQCDSMAGRYIGAWLIPDRHKSEVKGAFIVRATVYFLAQGYDLMNYYSTECESNFFRNDKWGQGAGFEMWHWNDEKSIEPGAKYTAIEPFETQYSRGGFAAMGLFGSFLSNGAYPISNAYWYVATMRNRLKGYIYIGQQVKSDEKIIVYCFKKKGEDKAAYVVYYNDNQNTGVKDVSLDFPEGVTKVTKVNVYLPTIPNPENVPIDMGIEAKRTGLPDAIHKTYTNGEWVDTSQFGGHTKQDIIYPDNPVEGQEIVVLPTAEENPYFPIVGPVNAKNTSHGKNLEARGTEYYDTKSESWKIHGYSKLAWRQVQAVCDYIDYTGEGQHGIIGDESDVPVFGSKAIVNVTEFPDYYFFDGLPEYDYNSTVTDISFKANGTNSVTIYWNNANIEDTEYKIFVSSEPNAEFTYLKNVTAGDSNSAVIDNLEENTTYYYKVMPMNGTKEGTLSESTSVKTFSYVAAASNLTLENKSVSTVTLKWLYSYEVLDDFIGYAIYRKGMNDTYSRIDTVTSQELMTYTDTKVNAGQVYAYKVQVLAVNGNSDYSNEMSITTKLPDNFTPILMDTFITDNGKSVQLDFNMALVNTATPIGLQLYKDTVLVKILSYSFSVGNKSYVINTDEVLTSEPEEDGVLVTIEYDNTDGELESNSLLKLPSFDAIDISKVLQANNKAAVSFGAFTGELGTLRSYDSANKITRMRPNRYLVDEYNLVDTSGITMGTVRTDAYYDACYPAGDIFDIAAEGRHINYIGASTGNNSFTYPDIYMQMNTYSDQWHEEIKVDFKMVEKATYKVRIFASTIEASSETSFNYVLNSGEDNELVVPIESPEEYSVYNNTSQWVEVIIPSVENFSITTTSPSDVKVSPLNIVEIIKLA